MFKEWQAKYGLMIYTIICESNLAIRKKRITTRARHICHKDGDIETLQNIDTKKFDYSVMPGKHIEIDTTSSSITENINKILKGLPLLKTSLSVE